MILSIGCSHSVGPYDENDHCKRVYGDLYYNTDEDWPSLLSVTKGNTKYRHIAMPGMGMLQYYEVLKYLDENRLLDDVNTLIIQWTHEPRHVLPNNKQPLQHILETDITKMMKDDRDFVLYATRYQPCMNVFSTSILTHIFNGKLTSKEPNTENKIFVTELISNIHEQFKGSVDDKNIQYLVKNEINRICINNNMKLFEIDWIKTIVDGLDLYNNIQYTNSIGHLNSLGNSKANNRIVKELKKQGFI